MRRGARKQLRLTQWGKPQIESALVASNRSDPSLPRLRPRPCQPLGAGFQAPSVQRLRYEFGASAALGASRVAPWSSRPVGSDRGIVTNICSPFLSQQIRSI